MKPYYDHKGITIYHGDCREILPDLPKVDLVLTDPPYGIGRVMKGGKGTGSWTLLAYGNEWDKKPIDKERLWNCMLKGNKAIVWGGNYFSLPPSRCWLVWNKTNAVPTMGQCELAWTNQDRPIQCFSGPVGNNNFGHPTEKPIKLITWSIIESRTNGTILDPFMGSGTTLRAAKDLGRKAIGIEIEEKYCEIAAKRLSQEVLNL